MQKTIQLSLFWLDTSNRINMFYIKRVCYLIMFLFVQTYAFAQTNYYKVDKTIYEDETYTIQASSNIQKAVSSNTNVARVTFNKNIARIEINFFNALTSHNFSIIIDNYHDFVK